MKEPVAAVSAGGVVMKGRDILLGVTIYPDPKGRWTLPRGTIQAGESAEEASCREVREETGVQAQVVKPLDRISYRYSENGVEFEATVHFFLMRPVGGPITSKDGELAQVEWVPLDEAIRRLPFENEKALLRQLADHPTFPPE